MTEAEIAALESQRIAALSREPFGREFATLRWVEFQSRPVDSGFWDHHRDYCGHGMLRTADGVGIFEVWDFDPVGHPLMEWKDRDSFIDFWSSQSDYGLCGEDPRYPRLQASRDFFLNNQRITRARIAAFLGWKFHATWSESNNSKRT